MARIVMTCLAGMGGSAIVAGDLACGLSERGHEVHMVSDRVPYTAGQDLMELESLPDRRTLVDPLGVLWHVVPDALPSPVLGGPELTYARYCAVFSSAVTSAQPDIINVHYAVPAVFAAAAGRSLLAPHARLIVSFHGTDASDPPPELVGLTALSLLEADVVTACSPWLVDLVRRRFSRVDVALTPNWVRPGAGPLDRDAVQAVRRELGIRRGERFLIHASNFRPVKQAAHALDALAGVVASGTRAQLVLVGDGEELPEVLAEAHERGLDRFVRAVGVRADAPRLIAAADLLVIPSASEAFSLAALEAAAAGVPTLGYDVGGMRSSVVDGRTGLLVAPQARGELSMAARALLDPGVRRRTRTEGPRHAARFSRPAMIDRYEQLLDPTFRFGRDRAQAPTHAIRPDSPGSGAPMLSR